MSNDNKTPVVETTIEALDQKQSFILQKQQSSSELL